eukprot:TRINITY_DN1975_c0_g1_i1.p1 TRINITY_DN1975_c0_g1~~TRINITY_DN1975_c0_g1_i1.p1  ORF type:complete len:264 (-),score=30.57 TRINITY_DN1975_c0_g1_i1:14-805(-)
MMCKNNNLLINLDHVLILLLLLIVLFIPVILVIPALQFHQMGILLNQHLIINQKKSMKKVELFHKGGKSIRVKGNFQEVNSMERKYQDLIGYFQVVYQQVSRTFGDVEAKIARLGGRPNVITAKPDIKQIQITTDLDYILLACDGIYDRMSNEEVSNCVKNPEQDNYVNIHQFAAGGVHKVLMTSLQKKSLDNVTVVLVGFKNFKTIFKYYQAQIKKTKFSLNNGYEEKKQNQSLFSQSSAQKLAQQESQKQNLLKRLIEKQK